MRALPYGRQSINSSDIRAVVEALKSNWLTQGPRVDDFEEALARFCGAKYAVAVSSGTAGLHLACMVAGLKKGDEAVTSPVTFLATPNAILYSGARPLFADINPLTGNIDPEALHGKISPAVKVILPVHYGGLPCDMLRISAIARKKKSIVIEDAAHALGAQYCADGKWIKVGSCRHSLMTVFSFHAVKHITTGEGGAVTTNSRNLYLKLRALRSHGLYKDGAALKKGPWYYEMRDLGFNYRLTDLQSALGISQLKRLDAFVQKRRRIVEEYRQRLSGIDGIMFLQEPPGFKSSHHLCVLRIQYKQFKTTRAELMTSLKNANILTQVHYIPIYRQPFYRRTVGTLKHNYPQAELFYDEVLSIPLFVNMTTKDVKYVSDHLLNILKVGHV